MTGKKVQGESYCGTMESHLAFVDKNMGKLFCEYWMLDSTLVSHNGVKYGPLIGQVHFTYSISSTLVYIVGVKDASVASQNNHYANIIISYPNSVITRMFVLLYFQSDPGLRVWQPVVCCCSVPPANKL